MSVARGVREGAHPLIALGCIAATAFLIRFLHVLSMDWIPTGVMADHVTMAMERVTFSRLLSPEGFFWLPPGYALFLKPFLLAAEPPAALFAVQVAQCLLGSFACLLLYRLGTHLHSRRAGLMAAFTACFYPHFVFIPAAWLGENLFIPLLLLALLMLSRAHRRDGSRRWYLAGAAVGAAAMVQAAALALLPVAAAAAAGAGGPSRRGRRALLLLAGVMTFILPWAVRNGIAYGHPVLVSPRDAFELAEAHHPSGDLEEPRLERAAGPALESIRRALGESASHVLSDPLGAVFRVSTRSWRRLWELRPPWPLGTSDPQLFAGEMFFPFVPWQIVMAGGIAGLGVLAQRRRAGTWILPAAAACHIVWLLLLSPVTRERLPLEALLIASAAAAATEAAGRLGVVPPASHRALGMALCAALLVVLVQSALSARIVRRELADPAAVIGKEEQFPLLSSRSPRVLFSEEPFPVDRRRGRFLRLSARAFRQGPWRADPANGVVWIECLDGDGEPLHWTLRAAYVLDAIPPDRWVDIELKSHLPPAAARCSVSVVADPASPDVLIIDRAALRYAGGNTAALEFLFPYLRRKE